MVGSQCLSGSIGALILKWLSLEANFPLQQMNIKLLFLSSAMWNSTVAFFFFFISASGLLQNQQEMIKPGYKILFLYIYTQILQW